MNQTLNIPDTNLERVVIVGAGFAGLTLARKLSKQNYQVVLLNKYNYHQFQPLYYQVAMAGLEPSAISFPLRKVFQKTSNVIIRICEVNGVDLIQKEVETNLGNLNFNILVMAQGATTNYYSNKAIEKYALPLKSVEESLALRNEILTDYENALTSIDYDERQELVDIVIVGGGPTGVELAGSLIEMKKYILPKDYKELDREEIDIYLIQSGDSLLKGMSENASEKARKFLESMGVKVVLNTRVEDFDGNYVFLNNGEKIRTKKLIWAAGIKPRVLKGFPENCFMYNGRMKTNRFSQVVGFNDIYALGDIAYMQTERYPEGHPQLAQPAIQQAKRLAKNLKRQRMKKAMIAFEYRDLGSMATIGRNKAVCDLPGIKLSGWLAWIIWLIVHLYSLIGIKNKLFVFINWIWNYLTYDQSLRLIIKPKKRN